MFEAVAGETARGWHAERARSRIVSLTVGERSFQAATTSRKSASIDAKSRQSESLECSASAAHESSRSSQPLVTEAVASPTDGGSSPVPSAFVAVCCTASRSVATSLFLRNLRRAFLLIFTIFRPSISSQSVAAESGVPRFILCAFSARRSSVSVAFSSSGAGCCSSCKVTSAPRRSCNRVWA